MADSKMTDTTSSQDFDESTRYFGRVKWFNNKAGYGFCTVVGDEGDERVGEDIFAHHTGVKVGSEQYKYLVQGEYVQFNLRSSDSTTHPYQAADLTGPWGGMLMCETRTSMRKDTRQEGEWQERRPRRRVRARGSGPRDEEQESGRENGRESGRGKRWHSKEWTNDRNTRGYEQH